MLFQPEVSDFVDRICLEFMNIDERHAGRVVAADKNLQNRMDKPGKYKNSLLILFFTYLYRTTDNPKYGSS